MFIQYLAEQGHTFAKLDKKPRRNVQYKDLCKKPLYSQQHQGPCTRADKSPASAVTHKENLEFLDDTIPKTIPYKEVKQKAAETRAKLTGAKTTTTTTSEQPDQPAQTNGKKQKTLSNGFGVSSAVKKLEGEGVGADDGDVQMTG